MVVDYLKFIKVMFKIQLISHINTLLLNYKNRLFHFD